MSEAELEALFDVLEGEAEQKYYIWKGQGWADKPAIIICAGIFAKLGKSSHTVYFGRGIADWTFKTEKQAKQKVMDILGSTLIKPLKVKQVSFAGREKVLKFPQ